jgi:hypothetical protein
VIPEPGTQLFLSLVSGHANKNKLRLASEPSSAFGIQAQPQ